MGDVLLEVDDAGLARDAAGCLITGFPGTTAGDGLRRAVAAGLGGVVLFTRNVHDAEQLTALTAALRAEREDVLIAIDHEGGEFSHLSSVDQWPLASPRSLGDLDDRELTRASAREAAQVLAGFGIDVMLAPSVDVNSNPANPIISTRSFGTTPDVVSRHGTAFVDGVHDAGIAACELPPFEAAIASGVDLVMTAHIVYSDYDIVPATLSRRILTGLLRDELGFTGVITTDALEMQGITASRTIKGAAAGALAAGADLAMVAVADADPADLAAALVGAVGNDQLPAERLAESATRVRRLGAALSNRRATSGWSGRVTEPSGTGDAVREVARRMLVGQDVPALGAAAYVADLAQPVHPAWRPYFDGLPQIFRDVTDRADEPGVVIRADEPGTVERVLAQAAGRALIVAVQDAGRTPWMVAGMRRLVTEHAGPVVVLCTGIPEDRALVPDGVPVVVTDGRNMVVLRAVAERLVREPG